MDKYYTPKIEEFVEGFKYQTKHSLGFSIMYFSNPEKSTKPEMKDYWFNNIVPNLDKPTYPYTITNEDGTTITFANGSGMYDGPLETIKIMLENGNIRSKK